MAGYRQVGRHLPDELLEATFRGAIVDELIDPSLHRPVSGRHPQIVLMVAQAGASTGALHAELALEFNALGGIVPLVTDELRIYHPDHPWLVGEHPEALIEQTDQAARWWQDRAAEHLAVRSYNIAFEDRFSAPDDIFDVVKSFDDFGYEVRVAATAVPAALSRLGIIETYARSVAATGMGPWISAEDHDLSYDELTEILYRAETSEAVTAITLCDRSGVVHERRRDASGTWPADGIPAIDALADARTEPLDVPQRTALVHRLAGTIEQVAETGFAPRPLYDMAALVANELAGWRPGLDGRTAVRLNNAMVALLHADARPVEHPLDTALSDLAATNEALDQRPEPPPPLEPRDPDLGPEM